MDSKLSNVYKKRAVIYCRVSTARQEDEGSSLDTQEAGCRAQADAAGEEIVAVLREVYTGAELFDRPDLTTLRGMVRRGEVDVVRSYALDRLTRNQAHLGLLLSEFDHAGVELSFVTERLEDTPEGRLLQSVRGYVAEIERLKIAERTQRGLAARAASGKPLAGCKCLYGYRWRDAAKSGLEIDPTMGAIVIRIFRQIVAGATISRVAADLTREGIPTPTGKRSTWTRATISVILREEGYTGEARAFRYRREKAKGQGVRHGRLVRRPDDEQVRLPVGTIPPLIDAGTFLAARHRLERNRIEATRPGRDGDEALLRFGFAKCGHCGCRLAALNRSGRFVYVHSPQSRDVHGCPSVIMSARKLDAAVWDRVEAMIRDPSTIAREIERRRASDPADKDLAAIDRHISDLDKRRERVARAISTVDDEEAVAPLVNELKSLATRKRTLEAERAAALARQAAEEAEQATLENLSRYLARVSGNLSTFTYAQRRDILTALAVEARVFNAEQSPRYVVTASIPPEAPELPTWSSEGAKLSSIGCGTRQQMPIFLRWTDADEELLAAD